MLRNRTLLLIAFATCSLSGCAAGLQDFSYDASNKLRAYTSWYAKHSQGERWQLGSDYAYGYRTGFYDASTGKACGLPAVPPPCYWSAKYQSCEGQADISAWYRGYQCGVAAAEGTGYPAFHDVPIGPCAPVINKTACGVCSGSDGCNCGSNVTPTIVQPMEFEEAPVVPTYYGLGMIGPVDTLFQTDLGLPNEVSMASASVASETK